MRGTLVGEWDMRTAVAEALATRDAVATRGAAAPAGSVVATSDLAARTARRRGLLIRASDLVRRLPPLWVRLLLSIDMALCVVFPPWSWFLQWRWTGKVPGPHAALRFYVASARFMWAHVTHRGEGTGAWTVDWRSAAVRRCATPENADREPRGSCGSCRNCCTTSWRPEGERLSCSFLGARGCTIYGGVFWDHFNCGRYPTSAVAVSAYACPRFGAFFATAGAPARPGTPLPLARPTAAIEPPRPALDVARAG